MIRAGKFGPLLARFYEKYAAFEKSDFTQEVHNRSHQTEGVALVTIQLKHAEHIFDLSARVLLIQDHVGYTKLNCPRRPSLQPEITSNKNILHNSHHFWHVLLSFLL